MQNLRLLSVFFLILFFSQNNWAQTEVYYKVGANKVLTRALVREYDEKPYYRFKLVYKDTVIYKYPDEVSEYTDGKTRVYESHNIVDNEIDKRVFLLREYKEGDITLYSFIDKNLEPHIFLRNGDELIRMSKKGRGSNQYLRVLTGLFEKCRIEREVRRYTTYNVGAMRRFLKSLNDCRVLYTPVPKLIAKINIGSLNPSPTFDFERPSEIRLGPLTLDREWDKELVYNVSFRYYTPFAKTGVGMEAGLSIGQHKSLFRRTFDFTTLLVDYKTTRAELPLFLSFSIPRDRWQPLFKIGAIGAYNFSDRHPFTEFLTDPNTNETQRLDIEIPSAKLSWGLGTGIELRHKLNKNLGALAGIEYILFFENGANRLIDANRFDISVGVSYSL